MLATALAAPARHLQLLPQPLVFGQVQRQQFFMAIELIGHRTLGYLETLPEQLLVNLRDTALLLRTQRPYQCSRVQAAFSGRQSACFFWFRWPVVAWTGLIEARVPFEREPGDSLQGGHRSMAVMAHSHPAPTSATDDLKRFKCHLLSGWWTRLFAGHHSSVLLFSVGKRFFSRASPSSYALLKGPGMASPMHAPKRTLRGTSRGPGRKT